MQSFLLLRNNKQSGPYSADDLRQMGLKPYDLIWVEGKSAAWRYPSEIDELKSFAPLVEEQPFDRFFKRPGKAEEKKEQASQSSKDTSVVTPMTGKINSPKRDKAYKRIFVTLPARANHEKAINETESKPEPEISEPQTVDYSGFIQPPTSEELPVSGQVLHPVRKETVYYSQENIQSNEPVTANYSRNEKVYYNEKRSGSLLKGLKGAVMLIGIICLVGLGIAIGIAIQKPETSSAGIKASETVLDGTNKNNTNKHNSYTQKQVKTLETPQKNVSAISDSELIPQHINKKQISAGRKNFKKDTANLHKVPLPVAETTSVKEKPPVIIEKKAEEKPMPNLAKLVTVTNNDYQIGPFGGISKLKLTVKNRSEYNLDIVVVQVDYIKVNKEVYKSENLYFKDISAGASVTVSAPKSSRGNNIHYKVSMVSSKDHIYHTE